MSSVLAMSHDNSLFRSAIRYITIRKNLVIE